jgi:hypothetical protein
MARQIKRGDGWQLGWDDGAPEFKGLIGGMDWSIELTEAELNDFCRLLSQLTNTLAEMATQLMDEEKITCEAESHLIWLEAEGYSTSFSLRLMLLQGRRAEGSWSDSAVPMLVQAAQTLRVF